VTVIEQFRFLHRAILRDRASNLTTPTISFPAAFEAFIADVYA
jgi:hypothetical protein